MNETETSETQTDKPVATSPEPKAKTPWYQKPARFNHDCKPRMPPNGSRRSMGKR